MATTVLTNDLRRSADDRYRSGLLTMAGSEHPDSFDEAELACINCADATVRADPRTARQQVGPVSGDAGLRRVMLTRELDEGPAAREGWDGTSGSGCCNCGSPNRYTLCASEVCGASVGSCSS